MSLNIFSVESLIAWLEMQPPETEYFYTNPSDCLLHRYFSARGLPVGKIYSSIWIDVNSGRHELPDKFSAISLGPYPKKNWTYGAALDRARAVVEG